MAWRSSERVRARPGNLEPPSPHAPEYALVLGVANYTRLPEIADWYPAIIGAVIVAGGLLAWREGPATGRS
jgi:hypothetical protein